MNILLDIAIGVAAGLAAFVLALVLLLHKLAPLVRSFFYLIEINDARDRDLLQASLHRFHKEHSK